jgi:hypothetical protein
VFRVCRGAVRGASRGQKLLRCQPHLPPPACTLTVALANPPPNPLPPGTSLGYMAPGKEAKKEKQQQAGGEGGAPALAPAPA